MGLVLGAAVTGVIGWLLITYNRLVGLRNNVGKAWSDIDVLLKQRHDELPQLVSICRSHMEYEKGLLERISTLRGAAGAIAAPGAQLYAAQNELSTAVRSLLAVSENYPTLKADQSLANLQVRITALENQIADRREFYNASVTLYNTGIAVAPDLLVARQIGLGRLPLWRVPRGQDISEPITGGL